MFVQIEKKIKKSSKGLEEPKVFKTLWQIMLYELLFKVITSLCLVPGIVYLIDFIVKVTGYTYISNKNIASIIKNPIIIGCFFVIGLLSAFMILIEIASLVLYFGHDFKGKKIYFRKLLFLSLKEVKRVLSPNNIILVLYILCIIPIINFITISSLLFTNIELPEILMFYIKRSKLLSVVLIISILVIFVLSIQMIFVFCYFFLEHKNLAESFECSKQLIRGRVIKTTGYIFACNIIFAIIYIIFYLLVITFVTAGVKFFDDQRLAFAIFLSIFNMTNKIVLIVISTLEIITNFSVTVYLYLKYSGKHKKKYPLVFQRKQMDFQSTSRVKGAIAIIILITTILNAIGIYYIINEDYLLLNQEQAKITSHRGNSIIAPENTLIAIEYAIRDLADYAEIDVQETKDGEIIVFHDSNLKRITGVNRNVWTLNYSEIKDLDAGNWFSSEFVGAKIPTLDEAIKLSKGKIKLNIEIKRTGHEKNLEGSVVQLIEENDFVQECVISSFNYKSLKKIKALNENIRTGYILAAVYGNFYDLEYADFFSMDRKFVTERIVTQIHKRGKQIHVWTVNKEYNLNRLADLGVDNIITDNPVMARNTIYSRGLPTYTLNFLRLIFNINIRNY